MPFLSYKLLAHPKLLPALATFTVQKIPHSTSGVNGYGQNPTAAVSNYFSIKSLIQSLAQ